MINGSPAGDGFIQGPRRIVVAFNQDFPNSEIGGDADAPSSYEANSENARTAVDIAGLLGQRGHHVTMLPIENRLDIIKGLAEIQADVVFNLVESVGGEASRESEFPALLKDSGIRFTGNSAKPLGLAQRKDVVHLLLMASGIPTPDSIAVRTSKDFNGWLKKAGRYPLIIKPSCSDGSIGIDQNSIVNDEESLMNRIQWVSKHFSGPVQVEEYLPGKEINVAVFPNPNNGFTVATEIDFSPCPTSLTPIVTYDCKWNESSPEFLAFSKPLADDVRPMLRKRLARLACAALRAVGADGYSRVDFRLDRQGRPFVIDINPNPCLDRQAGLALAAESVSVPYGNLVELILHEALSKECNGPTSHTTRRSGFLGRVASAN